jgi:hypothetical protein
MQIRNCDELLDFLHELAMFIDADRCAWHANVKRVQMPDELYRNMMINRHYSPIAKMLAELYESH